MGLSALRSVAACPQAKRLGGRGYVRLGWGWGRRQEARAETDVCSGLLEAEKCPLQSRALSGALAAGTRSGHIAAPWILQQGLQRVEYSWSYLPNVLPCTYMRGPRPPPSFTRDTGWWLIAYGGFISQMSKVFSVIAFFTAPVWCVPALASAGAVGSFSNKPLSPKKTTTTFENTLCK